MESRICEYPLESADDRKEMFRIIKKLGILPQEADRLAKIGPAHECDNIPSLYHQMNKEELEFLRLHNIGLNVTEEDMRA
jgi:hypothetical protein